VTQTTRAILKGRGVSQQLLSYGVHGRQGRGWGSHSNPGRRATGPRQPKFPKKHPPVAKKPSSRKRAAKEGLEEGKTCDLGSLRVFPCRDWEDSGPPSLNEKNLLLIRSNGRYRGEEGTLREGLLLRALLPLGGTGILRVYRLSSNPASRGRRQPQGGCPAPLPFVLARSLSNAPTWSARSRRVGNK